MLLLSFSIRCTTAIVRSRLSVISVNSLKVQLKYTLGFECSFSVVSIISVEIVEVAEKPNFIRTSVISHMRHLRLLHKLLHEKLVTTQMIKKLLIETSLFTPLFPFLSQFRLVHIAIIIFQYFLKYLSFYALYFEVDRPSEILNLQVHYRTCLNIVTSSVQDYRL